jgi:hypothetical protein
MEKTIYVIGAGASKEVGLPTGFELKSIISRLLDIRFDFYTQESGDRLITNALTKYVERSLTNFRDINPFLEEAWHIRDALPQAISIDNFIDSQKGNEKLALCGKLGIVKSILEAEKGSRLYFERERRDSTIDFNSIKETWYLPFFQLITENCSINDLEERLKSVVLVVFNYDRCIEHYLFYSLINYYKINEESASRLISNIEVYHPYGAVGSLPWQRAENPTDFGVIPDANKLLSIAENIKTFTEGTDPESSNIVQIRNGIKEAKRVVFMGFAFHKLNMELLKSTNLTKVLGGEPTKKCFATTLGISESDKEVVSSQISELFGEKVTINMANVSCNDLFSEFWRGLAF